MKQQTLKCSNCGTDNSSQRTICFNCHEKLVTGQKKNDFIENADSGILKKRVLRKGNEILPEKTAENKEAGKNTQSQKSKTGGKEKNTPIDNSRKFEQIFMVPSLKQRIQMYRQLHSLLKSGIPLALTMSYVEKNISYTIKPAMREIGKAVEKGKLLSEQAVLYPTLFSGWEISMIAAGEKSGNLPEVMDEISKQLEIEMEMKSQVSTKTWHLKATLFVAVLVGIFLTLLFKSGADNLGAIFNVFSRSVLFLGYVASAIIILIIAVKRFSVTTVGSVLAYNVMSRVPLYGPILKNQSILRFVNVLAAMVHAGVGPIESLQCAADATGNKAIITKASEAGSRLSQGDVMADVIGSMKLLPPETIYLIRTGENTGSLVEALQKTGEYIQLELSGLVKTLPSKLTLLVYVLVVAIVMYVITIAIGPQLALYNTLLDNF